MQIHSNLHRFTSPFGAALVIAAATDALVAQQVTVPAAAAAAANVPGIGELAGVSMTLRQQFLIGATHLQGLFGKELTELWFRRDGAYLDPLQGGALDLQLTISQTAVDPAAPSADFAANSGTAAPIVVFSGRVVVPMSPALTNAPWAAENTIRVPFTRTFTYFGGTLCLDLVGKEVPGQSSSFWPLDYVTLPSDAGSVTALGTSCSRFAAGAETAFAAPGLLVPGSTAMFNASGNPSTPGLFLLSASTFPGGVDLSPIGLTGCRLYAGSGIAFGVSYGPGIGRRGDSPGFATVHVQLPPDPTLMGASIYAQWGILELVLPQQAWSNSLGFNLSNGVQATIASSPNTLGLATITSASFQGGGPVPSQGYVNCAKGPVVRFLHN